MFSSHDHTISTRGPYTCEGTISRSSDPLLVHFNRTYVQFDHWIVPWHQIESLKRRVSSHYPRQSSKSQRIQFKFRIAINLWGLGRSNKRSTGTAAAAGTTTKLVIRFAHARTCLAHLVEMGLVRPEHYGPFRCKIRYVPH